MKKIALSIVLLLFVWSPTQAQQYFFDDFDTYNAGSYLGLQSSQWITWSSTGGSSEDVYVSNADAYSNSNSLYFYSANGSGPHDVVLDFGGVHNSGTFNYKAKYKIPTGGNSYFNFQGGASTGSIWSLDFYFNSGGSWSCQGGYGTFPHDQWFDLEIDVDFDTDTWKVYINGSLQSTFTNTNPISFLDLYEVSSNSEWYMDDVSFCINKGCNPDLMLEDLKLTPSTVCTHHEADVTVKITNNSTFAASSMVLGLYVGGDSLMQALNLNNLGSGRDTTITVSGLFQSSLAGTGIQVQALNLSGDNVPSNDTAKTTVTVLPSPSNAGIIKGTPYESAQPNTAGTMLIPDIVTAGHTLTYEVTPPSGYNNSGYGSTWDISNLTFYTINGTALANTFYSFSAPSGSANGNISFSPDTSLLDSVIVYSFAVNSLGNGCDSVLKRYINVVPAPDAQFTNTDVCDQLDMTFTNNSTLQTGLMTFLWKFGDGTSSTLYNPTHKYATYGVYTVRLIATSNYGYKDSMDVQVNVFQLPTADFTVTNACEGSDVTFTDQSLLPSGTPTFAWNFGDGTAPGTTQNIGHSYTVPGTYTVILTVTVNGCVSSKVKYGTQAPRAAPSFSSTVACNNTKAQFFNTSTLQLGTFGTHWKFGDGGQSTAKNPTHDYSGFGNFDVTMIITTDLGCIDSITSAITTTESPKPDFALSNACSEEVITMTNLTNTPQGGSNSYSWSFGNGQSSTDANPSTTYPAPGMYTVKLIAFNGNGCFDSIMKKVPIDAKPLVSFFADDVCLGTLNEFKNNTVNLPNGGSYVWDFGNGVMSTGLDTSFVYANTGDFTVSLIATTPNGCSDTATNLVSVNPLPDASFVVQSAMKGDGTMTFSANATNVAEYRWFVGDGDQYLTQTVIHQYKSSGNYTVKLIVTSNEDCISEQTETVSITPTSTQALNQGGMIVYPNPSNGSFTLTLKEKVSPNAIGLYSVNGQLIEAFDLSQLKDEKMTISMNGLSPGIYIIRVESLSGTWNQKIVIE